MSLGIAGGSQRDLVGTPGAFGLLAVDELRAGPALRGAEDDHRVERTSHVVGLGCGLMSQISSKTVSNSSAKRRWIDR